MFPYFKYALFSLCIIGLSLSSLFAQNKSKPKSTEDLKLWDDQPAKTWMTEAYPIGNGRIGGMVFGGVDQEHIQFNDNSLWSGDENDRGAYQAFGDLFIDFDNKENSFTNYRRTLDLGKSIQQISFTKNNVDYKREYFCSFPDKVMVLRYMASKKGAISGLISLKDQHGQQVSVNGNQLIFKGSLANGLTYQATALLKIQNGTSKIVTDDKGNSQLKIENADEVIVLLTGATNYLNVREKNWKGEEPESKIKKILAEVSTKPYPLLLSRHIADYQNLFSRVSLTLGSTPSLNILLPTHLRLKNYKDAPDHGLEALIFQYGRYLLISSSRKGGLPANLQGLWNETKIRLGEVIIIPTSTFK